MVIKYCRRSFYISILPIFVWFALLYVYVHCFAPFAFYSWVLQGCLEILTNISTSFWHCMIPKENYGCVCYTYINYDFYLCKFDNSLESGNGEYVRYKVKSFLVNWFFICFTALRGIVLAINLTLAWVFFLWSIASWNLSLLFF